MASTYEFEEFKLKPSAAAFVPRGFAHPSSQEEPREASSSVSSSSRSSPQAAPVSPQQAPASWSLFAKGNVFLDGWSRN